MYIYLYTNKNKTALCENLSGCLLLSSGQPPLIVGGVTSTDVLLVKLVPKTTHKNMHLH